MINKKQLTFIAIGIGLYLYFRNKISNTNTNNTIDTFPNRPIKTVIQETTLDSNSLSFKPTGVYIMGKPASWNEIWVFLGILVKNNTSNKIVLSSINGNAFIISDNKTESNLSTFDVKLYEYPTKDISYNANIENITLSAGEEKHLSFYFTTSLTTPFYQAITKNVHNLNVYIKGNFIANNQILPYNINLNNAFYSGYETQIY